LLPPDAAAKSNVVILWYALVKIVNSKSPLKLLPSIYTSALVKVGLKYTVGYGSTTSILILHESSFPAASSTNAVTVYVPAVNWYELVIVAPPNVKIISPSKLPSLVSSAVALNATAVLVWPWLIRT